VTVAAAGRFVLRAEGAGWGAWYHAAGNAVTVPVVAALGGMRLDTYPSSKNVARPSSGNVFSGWFARRAWAPAGLTAGLQAVQSATLSSAAPAAPVPPLPPTPSQPPTPRRSMVRSGWPASEKDAKLAQKLGQLQPFIAVYQHECMGQPNTFHAAPAVGGEVVRGHGPGGGALDRASPNVMGLAFSIERDYIAFSY
jgi:hypothetical protein